jgi:EAL domain-containing protein (putative c-di-GMP-specific phosphodiesterase class I)
VIAEGVENADVAAAMRALGIELGQGWHLGVPIEAGAVGENRAALALMHHAEGVG